MSLRGCLRKRPQLRFEDTEDYTWTTRKLSKIMLPLKNSELVVRNMSCPTADVCYSSAPIVLTTFIIYSSLLDD